MDNNDEDMMREAGAQAASGCALLAFAFFGVPILFGAIVVVGSLIGAIFL